MKVKSSYHKLVMWIIGGFILGVVGALIGVRFIDQVREGGEIITEVFIRNIVWFQLSAGVIFIAISIVNFIKSKELMMSSSVDNDDDVLEDRLDSIQSKALTFSAINYIVSFTLFGISIDSNNEWLRVSVAVFLFTVVVTSFLEIAVVNLVKKRDPMKKGDPAGTNFEKEWLESCDEAEKFLIYQAAYKSFSVMKMVLLVAMLLSLVFKSFFDTGNFPIVFVGTIWLIQTLSYSFYSTKLQRSNINL